MKVIGLVFLALLGVSYAYPPPLPMNDDGNNGGVHIPAKCSDVLAVKVCDNLIAVAKRLKLKAEDVTKAVVDAVKKGKTSSVDIYNAAKEYLKNEVMSKTCEDFTTQENCENLRKVAAMLKIKASKVNELVIDLVAEGTVQAKEIYSKAMEYYKNEIATKKCEDFLSADQCKNLRTIAGKLRIKMDVLEDYIKEAYLEKLGNLKEMFQQVVDVMKDYVLNTKCEDVFNQGLCDGFRKFAAATKVQLPVLMSTAVDLVIKGYDVSTALIEKVYKMVDYFYDCTDVFDQSSCDRIYKWAKALGVAKDKVEEYVRKYVPIAIAKGKDFYSDFTAFYLYAKTEIQNWFCTKTILCDDNNQQANDDMLAFADDTGFFDLNLIKQKVLEYIDIKYPGLQDKVKGKIMSIFNKTTSVTGLVRNALTEIVTVGGDAAKVIKTVLEDLVANIKLIIYQTSPSKDDGHSVVRRAIDLDVFKQKVKDFVEEKFPGLQADTKERLNKAIEAAKSKLDIATQFVKSFYMDKSSDIKRIVKEIIAKVNALMAKSN